MLLKFHREMRRDFSRFLLAPFVLLLSLTGCGVGTYEERLKESEKFYEYLDRLNSNLSPAAWDRREFDMSLRVPLPFRTPLPPPPKPKTGPDGEPEPGTLQPVVSPLGVELPGLLETWKTSFPNSNGFAEDAYLFVLSNHDRFASVGEGGPSPSSYFAELENLLSSLFQTTIPEGESTRPGDNVRYRLTVPARGSPHAAYTPGKDYSVIRFVPHDSGQAYQGLLFERRVGDIQAAIFVLCPQSITAQFRQRLDLALETFAVSGKVPRTATRPGMPSRTSTGGTGGF
ncbi:hypothetical protein [Planctomicrobium sp. SH664]|uniref:hypothetical protein n=1 Tax=Planctomicrobium sp. SH664 TaxID=3448125 RepID=UPI003F5C8AD0